MMLKINNLRKSHHILWNFSTKTTAYCAITIYHFLKNTNRKTKIFQFFYYSEGN